MTGTVVSWDDEQRCGAGSVRRLRRSSTRGGTRVADATTHNATPIGTLISSTQRHPKALVITPPSIGPSAPAEPDVALQIESARACSPVWVIVSRLRLLGTKAAAPTPWAQTAQLAANADGTLPSWSEVTGRVDLNHASGVGTYTTTVVLPAS
jgi:hypothetical protein